MTHLSGHWEAEDKSTKAAHEGQRGFELEKVVRPDGDQTTGNRVKQGHLLSQSHDDHGQVE